MIIRTTVIGTAMLSATARSLPTWRADVGAQRAADAYRRGRVVQVGVVGQQGRGCLVGGLFVADDVGQDQRVGAVARPQPGRVCRPVRRDAAQSGVGAQPASQGLARGGHGGAVDGSGPRVDQEDHVRLAAELLVEQRLRLARGRGRVVEAAAEQPAERADAEDGREHERQDAQREDEPGAGDDE